MQTKIWNNQTKNRRNANKNSVKSKQKTINLRNPNIKRATQKNEKIKIGETQRIKKNAFLFGFRFS
jgi:hypothetical protein